MGGKINKKSIAEIRDKKGLQHSSFVLGWLSKRNQRRGCGGWRFGSLLSDGDGLLGGFPGVLLLPVLAVEHHLDLGPLARTGVKHLQKKDRWFSSKW